MRGFFSAESDAQELTTSSASGVSCSSQDTVIDLAQGDPDDGEEPTTEVPAHARPRNATNWVWDYVHRLEEPVAHNNTVYTHICLLCLPKKSWQDSLCKARHTSNAKVHLVSIHKENEGAMKEKQHRSKRASRFDVAARPKEDMKRAAEPSEKAEQPAKRQKKLTWRALVSRDQISGHIARWLIRDGLPRNMTTTTAFREFLAGVIGEPIVIIPSHKTYNDILDKHYSNFKKDVSKLIVEEFKELFETRFLNMEHDLWSNSSKSCIVGASCSFINHHWQPRHIALLAEVKNDGRGGRRSTRQRAEGSLRP
ncbi:hypothetical protein V7S43_008308 [Phytophthora oleae]|uniref:BED-type domain-containing protein n=1 Tax=Phytophthora oleae TaxID=2107226 RepID=A0ABD3FNU7_9STRA